MHFCFLDLFVLILRRTFQITTLTLIVVIPVFILRVVANIIITIIRAVVAPDPAIALASDIIYGILHAIIMAMLLYFIMAPHLWGATSPTEPQFVPYVQQQPLPAGMTPPAHFSGQWGYTGQPQQVTAYTQSPQAPVVYVPANGYPQPQGPNFYPYPQPQGVPPQFAPQFIPPSAPSPVSSAGGQNVPGGVPHILPHQATPPTAS